MITEDYVSLETAKLLKEKGFDEKCMSYYGHGEFHLGNPKYMRSNTDRDGVACNGVPYDAYNAPTFQMAKKWLRKVHQIDMWVECHNRRYKGHIHSEQREYEALFYEDSYEQAFEKTIKYCLENLI